MHVMPQVCPALQVAVPLVAPGQSAAVQQLPEGMQALLHVR